VLGSRMMRLLSRIAGGCCGTDEVPSFPRQSLCVARPPASFSQELSDALESAIVSVRESDDDGPRVVVMTPALRGAFVFDPEEAARRIRLAFPELPDAAVARGVRQLTTRVRLAAAPPPSERRRRSWVFGWMEP